jgi:hypothetical protein
MNPCNEFADDWSVIVCCYLFDEMLDDWITVVKFVISSPSSIGPTTI